MGGRKRKLTSDNPRTEGLTGWAEMAAIVQNIDEAKIKDCKEDIDTLLVFAGLFSAVLTAFIIDSYKWLSEDSTQVAADTLKEIKQELRSYRLSGEFFNSTYPSIDILDTPFSPTSSAVLVNVLWFLSLTLSLTTASIGILVKQWLREYVTGDFVSPQTKLRARHFRNPGLKSWRVYEIAAFLPLLLQTSLGLFFLGLCVFTWGVHHSVGYASCTLVIGWLTFFTLTTIAPLFSSRCPYKTTFLKRTLAYIHYHIRIALCNLGTSMSKWQLRASLARAWKSMWSSKWDQWLFVCFILLWALFIILPQNIAVGLHGLHKKIYKKASSLFKQGVHVVKQWLHAVVERPLTEQDVLNTTHQDPNILLAVDAALADDHLLRTTIWDTFEQLHVDTTAAVSFMAQLMRHRIPAASAGPFKLQTLNKDFFAFITPRISEAITQCIADASSSDKNTTLLQNPSLDWITGATQFLCDKSQAELSEEDIVAILRLTPLLDTSSHTLPLGVSPRDTATIMLLSRLGWKRYQRFVSVGLWTQLGDLTEEKFTSHLEYLLRVSDDWGLSGPDGLSCTAMLVSWYSRSTDENPLNEVLRSVEMSTRAWNTLANVLREALIHTITNSASSDLDLDNIQDFFYAYMYAHISAGYNNDNGACSILVEMLRRQEYTAMVLQSFYVHTEQFRPRSIWFVTGLHIVSSLNYREQSGEEVLKDIVNNLHTLLRKQISDPDPSSARFNSLEICVFITGVAYIMLDVTAPFDPAWYALSQSLAEGIRSLPNDQELWTVTLCLVHIDYVSRRVSMDRIYGSSNLEYSKWLRIYDPERTFFCDDLVEALMDKCMLSMDFDGRTMREMFPVRRILDIRQQRGQGKVEEAEGVGSSTAGGQPVDTTGSKGNAQVVEIVSTELLHDERASQP